GGGVVLCWEKIKKQKKNRNTRPAGTPTEQEPPPQRTHKKNKTNKTKKTKLKNKTQIQKKKTTSQKNQNKMHITKKPPP
ncbi:hypothetical protein ACQWF5_26120, partial [Salmonella enterica subsp. enterica serovar Infantis]